VVLKNTYYLAFKSKYTYLKMNWPLDFLRTTPHQSYSIFNLLPKYPCILCMVIIINKRMRGSTWSKKNILSEEVVTKTLSVFIVINSEESILPALINVAIFPKPIGCKRINKTKFWIEQYTWLIYWGTKGKDTKQGRSKNMSSNHG